MPILYHISYLSIFEWLFLPCVHEAGSENQHHSLSSSEEGEWALPQACDTSMQWSYWDVVLPTPGGLLQKEKRDIYPREAEGGFEEISWPWGSGRSMVSGLKPPRFQLRLYLDVAVYPWGSYSGSLSLICPGHCLWPPMRRRSPVPWPSIHLSSHSCNIPASITFQGCFSH